MKDLGSNWVAVNTSVLFRGRSRLRGSGGPGTLAMDSLAQSFVCFLRQGLTLSPTGCQGDGPCWGEARLPMTFESTPWLPRPRDPSDECPESSLASFSPVMSLVLGSCVLTWDRGD